MDGEGFGGGEVGGEVGHAVWAAAQGDAAFADRGGAALAYAVGVVGGDDAAGVGQDRVASGAPAGGEGGQEPVDDLAVDGVAVQGVHGAHVACEQGGGGFVEAAGVHGLDEGGELGDQGDGQGEQAAGAVVVDAVGGDDLTCGDGQWVDDGVFGALVQAGAVAGGDVAQFLFLAAGGPQVVAGAQSGGGRAVLGVQRGQGRGAGGGDGGTAGHRSGIIPGGRLPHVHPLAGG
nr:hypothetical protein [Dietzia sp. KRD202]